MSTEFAIIEKLHQVPVLRDKNMLSTLGVQFPSYMTVKNYIASFKRGKFSIEGEDRWEKLVSVSTPVNINAIHMIF